MSKQNEPWMPLAEALRLAGKQKPWLASTAIRAAVVAGSIPVQRSSNKKRSRYFVRWPEFTKLLDKLSK